LRCPAGEDSCRSGVHDRFHVVFELTHLVGGQSEACEIIALDPGVGAPGFRESVGVAEWRREPARQTRSELCTAELHLSVSREPVLSGATLNAYVALRLGETAIAAVEPSTDA
jgi:hypothetical protein